MSSSPRGGRGNSGKKGSPQGKGVSGTFSGGSWRQRTQQQAGEGTPGLTSANTRSGNGYRSETTVYVSPGGRGHVPLTEDTTRTVTGAATGTSNGAAAATDITSGAATQGAIVPVMSASGDARSGELATEAAAKTATTATSKDNHLKEMSNLPGQLEMRIIKNEDN